MMQSLRARLIAGLLALTAVGLLAAATVTYVEQRSFLLDRVDEQAVAAAPAMAHQLDDDKVPKVEGALGGHFPREPDDGRGGPRPDQVNLPPGTYGQRRTANGRVLGHTTISYGDSLPSPPKIPAKLPIGKAITVDSVDNGATQYRVVASADRNDSGVTVVAVPLGDVRQTLDRLLRVAGLV